MNNENEIYQHELLANAIVFSKESVGAVFISFTKNG
jgi:hypothetical protein